VVTFDPYATHLPILLAAVAVVQPHTAIDLGIGRYSTLALALTCREVYAIEDKDEHWLDVAEGNLRQFVHVYCLRKIGRDAAVEWLQTDAPQADLVMVDNRAEARRPCVLQAMHLAPLVLAHDTEPGWDALYQLRGLETPAGWTRKDFTAWTPHTTVWARDRVVLDRIAAMVAA
jgi:hypothetical protein